MAQRIFRTEIAEEPVTRPNQYWGGDITYVPTSEGLLYLAVFLDLFTRKIVGYAMKDTLHASLVTEAVQAAIGNQEVTEDLVNHTDRGSQYASDSYLSVLSKNGITASMSRKGNCYDNAMVKSFYNIKS